jgi:hypothetical protein
VIVQTGRQFDSINVGKRRTGHEISEHVAGIEKVASPGARDKACQLPTLSLSERRQSRLGVAAHVIDIGWSIVEQVEPGAGHAADRALVGPACQQEAD